MNNKIIYHDTAPGAEDDATFAMTDTQQFTNIKDILQRGSTPKTATLEQDYWRLDGSFALMNNPQNTQWGIWSKSMSGIDGTFANPPMLEITFAKKHSSVGISFDFDRTTGDYCNLLTIKWYRDALMLGSQSFAPNAAHFACIRKTESYNKLVITFEKTSKPYRYLRVQGILFGMERIFESDELQSITALEEINPAGVELSVNTINFGLRSKSDVPFMFQKKQPLYLYHGNNLLGMYFIDKSKQLDRNQYNVDGICGIGVLDESDFMGGIYTGQTTGSIAAQIVGDSFLKLEIDSAVAAVPVYGYLPICTKREALAQLAFAAGAAVVAARSKTIKMYRLKNEIKSTIDDGHIFYGLDVDTAAIVTGIEVVAHTYTKSQEVQELYNGILHGSETLTFSEPMHSLEITGGTVIESGANYAIITANGNVVLTGKKYAHITKTTAIANTNVSAADLANVKKIENATLVGGNNVEDVANLFWHCAKGRNKINGDIILRGEQAGDRVSVATPFLGTLTGRISSLDITAGNELTAKAVIDCD